MKTERNLSRRASGMRTVFPYLVVVVGLVLIFGARAIFHQGMSASRQRIDGMKHEMRQIETALVSLQAQQGAMMTPESLNQRLQSQGTALVKIPARSYIYIEETARDEGMAMGNGPATSIPR